VDVRSDVYALGCCAYELLTGRRLVAGRSAVAKINAHIDGVRPRWPQRARVPLPLRRLIERCLARRPEARPPNMHVLQAELERVSAEIAARAARGGWVALARSLRAALAPRRSPARTSAAEGRRSLLTSRVRAHAG